MSELNLYELKSVHAKRHKTKAEIFEKQYKKACHKIKHYNDKFLQKHCSYVVPNLQWGYPLFDIKTCIYYIMLKLKKSGFDVKYIQPNTIYVSWDRAMRQIDNDVAIQKAKESRKVEPAPSFDRMCEQKEIKSIKESREVKSLTLHSHFSRKSYGSRRNVSAPLSIDRRPADYDDDCSSDDNHSDETASHRTNNKTRERVNKTAEIRALIAERAGN